MSDDKKNPKGKEDPGEDQAVLELEIQYWLSDKVEAVLDVGFDPLPSDLVDSTYQIKTFKNDDARSESWVGIMFDKEIDNGQGQMIKPRRMFKGSELLALAKNPIYTDPDTGKRGIRDDMVCNWLAGQDPEFVEKV